METQETRGVSVMGMVVGIFVVLLLAIIGLYYVNQPEGMGDSMMGETHEEGTMQVTPNATDTMMASTTSDHMMSTSSADAMAAHGTDAGAQMETGVIPATTSGTMMQ